MNQRSTSGFAGLGLPAGALDNLCRLGFTEPTPIQRSAIPVALQDRDVLGVAQTGTGKTLAFGLPMLCNLRKGETGLVLAPTRELAEQIASTLQSVGATTALLIGGTGMGPQARQLRARPDAVVATPGRLLDHLQQGSCSLADAGVVVLDEADRMLDMGFAPAIKKILAHTPKNRQTLLFSATMPKEIEDLARAYMHDPQRIEVAPEGTAAEGVAQELVVVPHEEKREAFTRELARARGPVLVFARTRHGARKLARSLRNEGTKAAEIHSDRTLAQRREALAGFKSGAYRVLVATDVAARGIDVKDIAVVINYDVPDHAEAYVHRIGRTGRAGAQGRAVTLATPQQMAEVRDIERLIGKPIPRRAG